MRVAICFFSRRGNRVSEQLKSFFQDNGHEVVVRENEVLSEWTLREFESSDLLVFIGATGIAVRAIAPYLKHKSIDPAVVVVDDHQFHAISLLSGHLGGANTYTRLISEKLGCCPVITTATDLAGVFAADQWAKERGFYVDNPEKIKDVSSRSLKNQKIRTLFEQGVSFKYDFFEPVRSDALLYLGYLKGSDALRIIIPMLHVGVGCRKNIPSELFEKQLLEFLYQKGIHLKAIKALHSIDIKKHEKAICDFSERYEIPFITHSAEMLNQIRGVSYSSSFVKKTVGTDNVCERAALIDAEGLLIPKICLDKMTISIGYERIESE